MTSACIEETAESPAISPFETNVGPRIIQLRPLPSDKLGCTHDELVFDDINDVHCSHCGSDFTD